MFENEIIEAIFAMTITFGFLIGMALLVDWLETKYKKYKKSRKG